MDFSCSLSDMGRLPLSRAVHLFALLLVVAPVSAQQILYLNNNDFIINDSTYRGYDVVVNASSANPISVTVTTGGVLSSNPNPNDGYQGVEIFNRNSVSVIGGVILAEGGRPGGITAHDNSAAAVSDGSMDYLLGKDHANLAIGGGTVGTMTLTDSARGDLTYGTLSSAMAYQSSRLTLLGGTVGPTGLFAFDTAQVDVRGANLLLFNGTPTVVQGRSGVSYRLRGSLEFGSPIDTHFFSEGALHENPVMGILFNGRPVIAVNLPETESGVLVAVGLTLYAAYSVTFCSRKCRKRGGGETKENYGAGCAG